MLTMRNNYLLFLIGLLFIQLSCDNESIAPDEEILGRSYYPVETGKYITYSYDSVIIVKGGLERDSLSGFLKDEIGEKLNTSNGEESYRVYKYWKRDILDPWRLINLEVLTKSINKVILSEGNLSFIKMVFPNEKGITWDGNALFDERIEVMIASEPIEVYNNWEYEITDKNLEKNILGEIRQVLEVLHVDQENALQRRFSSESYVKGVGLVSKNMMIYDTQNFQPNKPWETFAQGGFRLVQEMIEHN